jgi:hypothetical protein
MSHFAQVIDGIVQDVIVAEQDFIDSISIVIPIVDTPFVFNPLFPDAQPPIPPKPFKWIETSYNTRGNVHYNPNTGLPDKKPPLRGNFAGIGYIYDAVNDVFYAPQPYPSWILNNSNWTWEAPTPMPNDGNNYAWDEPSLSWIQQETKI